MTPARKKRLSLILLLVIGLISLIYGGLLAWRQCDMKRMVAYSSVSHMGVVLIGIATLNQSGLTGAVYQMVAHGLVAGLLFMLVGLLYERTHTRNINHYTSLINITPRFSFLLTAALIAGTAMPISAGFIAEIHVLIGGFQQWAGVIALMIIGMMMTAVYSLYTCSRLFTGPTHSKMSNINDLTLIETSVASALVILVLVFGLYPTPLLQIMSHSVDSLLALLAAASEHPDLFVQGLVD